MELPMGCMFVPIKLPPASPMDLVKSHGNAHGEAHGTQQQVLWEGVLFRNTSHRIPWGSPGRWQSPRDFPWEVDGPMSRLMGYHGMSHPIGKDIPWNPIGHPIGLPIGLLCTDGKSHVTPCCLGNPMR